MTDVSTFVNPVISTLGRGIVRKSFGHVLVVGKHDAWGERYRVYDAGPALQNIVADGIAAGTPIYVAANSALQATPKISKIIVGRLVDDFDQTFTLIVQSTVTVGDVYSFNLRAPNGGSVTAISYTAQTGDTPTLVAAALQALIDAVSGITATSSTPSISCAADNSNEMWQVEDLDPQQIWFLDTTVDSTLATEIGQIEALYSDWYGLCLADCPSNARLLACAAYVNTLEKIMIAESFDTDNGDSGSTTSSLYDLNAASYDRVALIVSNDQSARAGAAWMGKCFPNDPGSQTWAFKTLTGITYDDWTATFENTVNGLNGNLYTRMFELDLTHPGKMVSGEWIDVIRGRDWLLATIREYMIALLAGAKKIPYTDAGVQLVVKEIRKAQQEGIKMGFLAADPAPFVTFPLVADVSTLNKANRRLPDIYFEQTLAGAIQYITPITGVLKV